MNDYDLIVIGGGPAGQFAAGFAAQRGARVLLLEKNRQCGAKILITGKGRCNVTNSEPDLRRFANRFGRNGKALLTALYAYDNAEVVRFFEQRGLALRQERGGRVFPAQGGARQVQQLLDRFVAESGAELKTDCLVQGLELDAGRVVAVQTARGRFAARRFVIATGGLSYPQTGSTGDGYRWAEAAGHRLVTPEPALVPLLLRERWTERLLALNLKNVELSVWQDGRKLDARFGEAFFTRGGIGGPIVLDLSATVRDALKRGEVSLKLDLKPAIDDKQFAQRIERELREQNNRDFRNALGNLLPKDMIPLYIELSAIDPHKKCHSVTREERRRLLALFKGLELKVRGCEGFERAIVTAGGVSLKDVDMRTMRSKKIDNLYFAGEVLDLDAPTGGFNLQVCWSTGYLAGISAAGEAE